MSKKRAPKDLHGKAARQQGKLIFLPRSGPMDAQCRRCDDSGVLPVCRENWEICTCNAGARVLEQREQALARRA